MHDFGQTKNRLKTDLGLSDSDEILPSAFTACFVFALYASENIQDFFFFCRKVTFRQIRKKISLIFHRNCTPLLRNRQEILVVCPPTKLFRNKQSFFLKLKNSPHHCFLYRFLCSLPSFTNSLLEQAHLCCHNNRLAEPCPWTSEAVQETGEKVHICASTETPDLPLTGGFINCFEIIL